MGKKRIIAETGAGQHGVATATEGAGLDLKAEIYRGYIETEGRKKKFFFMEFHGAKIIFVKSKN